MRRFLVAGVNCTIKLSWPDMSGNVLDTPIIVICIHFDLDVVGLAKTDIQVLIEEVTIEGVFGILLEVSCLLNLIVDVSELGAPLFKSMILHDFLKCIFRLTLIRHSLQL